MSRDCSLDRFDDPGFGMGAAAAAAALSLDETALALADDVLADAENQSAAAMRLASVTVLMRSTDGTRRAHAMAVLTLPDATTVSGTV